MLKEALLHEILRLLQFPRRRRRRRRHLACLSLASPRGRVTGILHGEARMTRRFVWDLGGVTDAGGQKVQPRNNQLHSIPDLRRIPTPNNQTKPLLPTRSLMFLQEDSRRDPRKAIHPCCSCPRCPTELPPRRPPPTVLSFYFINLRFANVGLD